MIQIKELGTGLIVYEHEGESLRQAVIEAIAEGASLEAIDLEETDLSGADMSGAHFLEVSLAGANLTGADLTGANLTGANLTGANLTGADLTGANLTGADLTGANLTGADLSGATLWCAYLDGAVLDGAVLEGVNIDCARGLELYELHERTDREIAEAAKRYRERHPEVPVVDNLDRKILDAVTTGNYTLDMGDWHACETSHCRAGFAVHFAGLAGDALEARYGPRCAGAMIYRASTGRVPQFNDSNENALEDIRACAARQVTID